MFALFYILITKIQLVHNLLGIPLFQNSFCPDAGKSTPHPHPCPMEAHLKGDSASFWELRAPSLTPRRSEEMGCSHGQDDMLMEDRPRQVPLCAPLRTEG